MNKFGIIAEDVSDYESVCTLIKRITKVMSISSKRKIGDGKGKILRKSLPWCTELIKDGCTAIIIIIDQDRGSENEIRKSINASLSSITKPLIICVPIEEIEAWILSDVNVVKKVFEIKVNIKEIPNPESVKSPKEELVKIIKKATDDRKFYVKTSHNNKLFEQIDLSKMQKCKRFAQFKSDILSLAGNE